MKIAREEEEESRDDYCTCSGALHVRYDRNTHTVRCLQCGGEVEGQ